MMKLTKRYVFLMAVFGMVVMINAPGVFGQTGGQDVETKKRGQTGMKFLSFSVDARAQAMGNAVTADLTTGAVSLFYNPATMAWSESSFDVGFGTTQWIADINYHAGAAAFRPGDGEYGVFGVSLMAVDYGDDFIGTVRDAGASGYRDTGTFAPSAWALGLGYAKKLSDKFSFGFQGKVVSEDLGDALVSSTGGDKFQENSKTNFALDFGIIYRTGFKSLNLAMTARNFASEVQYAEENFELPLTFRIGVNMDMVDLTQLDPSVHKLVLAVDTERPRDFDEQIKVGAEYTLMNLLSLRGGYAAPTDEESFSLGAGIQKAFEGFGVSIDYSFTSFGAFDNVNRFMARFQF